MATVKEVTSEAQKYLDMFTQYDKEYAKWEGRVEKILKRYRDERTQTTDRSHYNILWANVRTLKPAIYARPPMPEVSRRFNDQDDIGRCGCGRSPTGKCIGWHGLTEQQYQVKLAEYIAEKEGE